KPFSERENELAVAWVVATRARPERPNGAARSAVRSHRELPFAEQRQRLPELAVGLHRRICAGPVLESVFVERRTAFLQPGPRNTLRLSPRQPLRRRERGPGIDPGDIGRANQLLHDLNAVGFDATERLGIDRDAGVFDACDSPRVATTIKRKG